MAENESPDGEQPGPSGLDTLGLTKRETTLLGLASGAFGVFAGVAQLVTSTWQTWLETLVVVLAIGLVLLVMWWAQRRGRRTRLLSLRAVAALMVAAIVVGAGATVAIWLAIDGRTAERPRSTSADASQLPTATGPPIESPPTTASPVSQPTSAGSLSPNASPATTTPPAQKTCTAPFKATVQMQPAQDTFDVVASFDCVPPGDVHLWIFVRLGDVGPHKTTNYYALEEFTGEPSPHLFHSNTAERRPSKCYLVVLFTGANSTAKEYVDKLPSKARVASDCVS